MKEIKEKPKADKGHIRSRPALALRQRARRLADRYRKKLDQRPEGREDESGYAVDQVEDSGRFIANEAAGHIRPLSFRERATQKRAQVDLPFSTAPKERQAQTIKAKSAQDAKSTFRQQGETRAKEPFVQKRHAASQSYPSIHPKSDLPVSETPRSVLPTQNEKKSPSKIKSIRPKTRSASYTKGPSAPKTARAVLSRPAKATKSNVQRQMIRQAAKQAKQAAKKSAVILRRMVAVVKKAAAALVSSLAGLVGGGVLVILLIVVAVVAAIANSPFGIFFAEERSSADTVSVAEAVASVNSEFNTQLDVLQSGDYDHIDIQGSAADWPDVLAVFAARYAAAEDGVDVATLDADRVSKLSSVFWDMTAISSTVETIHHADSDPEDEVDDSWTETILHISISAKSADDMKAAYTLSAFQIDALDELLSDRAALASLAGSLEITNADALAVLQALPSDLDPMRKAAVQTALSLCGKVGYFWGGKSLTLGWDSRWGTLQRVTASGSNTTGAYRPYGLDCSGFVDWAFYNATGGAFYPGHGGGAASQHSYSTDIPQSEAQPGDLAFYADNSHVGIIAGRDENGRLLVCHCSTGSGVVVTEFSASGFSAVSRPEIFTP